jgi:hypothetical protein
MYVCNAWEEKEKIGILQKHFPRRFTTSSPQRVSMCASGLPDSSWHNIPKRGKIYQISTKLLNDLKIYPTGIIYSKWALNTPKFSIVRPSKIYPNWDFWFENIPSGNPACAREIPRPHLNPFCILRLQVGGGRFESPGRCRFLRPSWILKKRFYRLKPTSCRRGQVSPPKRHHFVSITK